MSNYHWSLNYDWRFVFPVLSLRPDERYVSFLLSLLLLLFLSNRLMPNVRDWLLLPRDTTLRLYFHWDNFNGIKLIKSGNTVKTPRFGFSYLKMQGVFTSKNKGFSSLCERKFTQSYTTSRDDITCPDKHRSQSGKLNP